MTDPTPQARPVEQEIADVLAVHSPPAEVLTSLGDAWATCGCTARCDLTVTDDKINTRELADWWRAHVAAAIAPIIARERAAAAKEALAQAAGGYPWGARRWLRDRADRIGGDPT